MIHGLKANCVRLCLPTQVTPYGHMGCKKPISMAMWHKERHTTDWFDYSFLRWFWGDIQRRELSVGLQSDCTAWSCLLLSLHILFYHVRLYKYSRGSLGKVRDHSTVGRNSMLVKAIIGPRRSIMKRWFLFKEQVSYFLKPRWKKGGSFFMSLIKSPPRDPD